MLIRITVRNLQAKTRLKPSQIVQKTKKILNGLRIADADLSLVFVTDRKIKAVNQKFLGHAWPTDVLAFDLAEKPLKRRIVGEIIISTDRAIVHAKRYKTSVSSEISLYLIHGILHLIGFRDHTPKDIKQMRRKEQQLLGLLKK